MKTYAMAAHPHEAVPIVLYDRYLFFAITALLAIGLLMVASTSIVVSERQFGEPFHFLLRQVVYLLLGIGVGGLAFRLPILFWEKIGFALLLLSLGLLSLVLVHGIGRQINGSMRWLGFGPLGFEVSEFAKLAVIIYMAGYLVRHAKEVSTQLRGFIKPLCVLGIVALLLLKEPDFGAATVITVTCLGMLFLAGVRLWQFAVLLAIVITALATLAITSPYRLERVTTFLNPWANQFDSGYQLTQSLIAFGRGGWFGVGLGDSVQKLFYLPEAHTDFLFAVITEELGLIGSLVIIALFGIVVVRAMQIGRKAYVNGRFFAAFLAYGLGMIFALQAMVNIGVNVGVLPTKGLTLPLMSYGGSSLIMMCAIAGILLRIDYEHRLGIFGFRTFGRK